MLVRSGCHHSAKVGCATKRIWNSKRDSDCHHCLQTPGPTAAKRLFRASLLFLPLYMLGMVAHRIPQTQEHQSLQQVMTRARLSFSLRAHQAPEQRLGAPSHGALLSALTAAPFPFLPVPLRCPSKVACEAGPDAKEAPREAGS